jgi:hypothetical protein
MRDAVPCSIELCLIPVVQADSEAVRGELEGNTVPHQPGPDHSYALDVVKVHRRLPSLPAVWRLTVSELTRSSGEEFGATQPCAEDLYRVANSRVSRS